MRLWIGRGASFLGLLLLGAVWLGFAAQASPITEQAWTASGPGMRAAVVEAATGDMNFSYQFTGSQVHSGLSWNYTSTATVTESVYYNWIYTGLHAWFQASAKVDAFAYGPDNDYREVTLFDGDVWHYFTYSGQSKLQVHAGYAYGFKIYGKNFDSNTILSGNLAIVTNQNPPQIVPVVSGTQGTGGWYRSDVQLVWNVTTNPAFPILSQTGCGPVTINADTPGSVFTCTATSAAGTTTNSVTLKRDATAPAITGTTAVPPNDAGWYTSPVTVQFHCSDAMSNVSSCTPGTVVMTEGANQSVTGTAVDYAGNSVSTTVTGIYADWTPPATTDNAPTRAVQHDVSVALTAVDNVSVVNATYYRINGSEAKTGNSIGLTSEGAYSIIYWSKDSAGNVEPQRSAAVVIDRTPPVTVHNAPAGPVSRNVTVTLTPSDNLTAIAATYYKVDGGSQQSGNTVTITTAGVHAVEYWSVDQAGNIEVANTIIVTIDMTPPLTTDDAPTRAVQHDVTVTLTASDNVSVINATYYQVNGSEIRTGNSFELTAEGAYSIVYWSKDSAGNVEPQRSAAVVIDKTPPATAHNAPAGPVSRNVTVTLTPSDSLTAIAATYYKVDGGSQQSGNVVTLSVDGIHAVEYWSEDQAGNIEGANTIIVIIDKTPPITTARVTPDGAVLRLQGQDNLSVQVATYYRLDNGNKQFGDTVSLNMSGFHTISYWSEDDAGNSESPNKIVYLDIDGNGRSDIVDVVMAVNAKLDANGDGLFTREDVSLVLQSVTTFQPMSIEY
ncbi:hypothetical protein FE783_25235 [Paenibacillus mesophilus]|uniref:OmpL47-type beta-barrel domain-containing protein n=1 Tax=Paenibacillus mesophilus TaxID=2582849 RepID=UPI00110E84D4|nr:hypothetical protein [Paenibacillus mesophilus]TMV46617.1 hypothetical protein FE783_25235 [Paenibacillus mesophilus]